MSVFSGIGVVPGWGRGNRVTVFSGRNGERVDPEPEENIQRQNEAWASVGIPLGHVTILGSEPYAISSGVGDETLRYMLISG